MNKQSFFPMSNDVALDFILYLIQPDNPPLGIPFGWKQPKDSETITLGSIYVSCDVKLSLKDLIYGEMKDTYQGYNQGWIMERSNKEFTFPADMDSYYLRNAITEFTGRNVERKISGIWECENIHCQYSELERDEKLLYHLSIMGLNTMTDIHNWCVSYLEYLAYNHYSLSEHGQEWRLYESDTNNDICAAVSDLIPYCANIPDMLGFYGYTIDNNINDECYHYFNKWGDENIDTQEWIKTLLEVSDSRLETWDIRDYDKEIIGTLAAIVEWIKQEWKNNNLTLSYSDDMPDSIKHWYKEFESQELLPGILDT